MAEFILSESNLVDRVKATVYADTVTGLPTRVEVSGVSGKYRFTVSSPDKTRSFTTTFDSDTVISRTIGNAVASRYTSDWTIGIEGA